MLNPKRGHKSACLKPAVPTMMGALFTAQVYARLLVVVASLHVRLLCHAASSLHLDSTRVAIGVGLRLGAEPIDKPPP